MSGPMSPSGPPLPSWSRDGAAAFGGITALTLGSGAAWAKGNAFARFL